MVCDQIWVSVLHMILGAGSLVEQRRVSLVIRRPALDACYIAIIVALPEGVAISPNCTHFGLQSVISSNYHIVKYFPISNTG